VLNTKVRLSIKERSKKKKGKTSQAILSTFLIICILGISLLFTAGCAQNVIGWAVRTFVPYQEVHIPATEFGLDAGELVLRLDFKNFGCGGDDVYSNWWINYTDIWARLFDARASVPVLGHVDFEVWVDDFDFYSRWAWQGNSLYLDHCHADVSGFGFDIEGFPDEIEQWFFGLIEDMIEDVVKDKIIGVVNDYITQEKLSNIFAQQSEYCGDTWISSPYPRGGVIDETHGDNYYKDVGWASSAGTAYPHMFVMPYSPSVRLAYFCDKSIDLGKEYSSFKVTLKAMVKKRPGADPNQSFASLNVGGGQVVISLKPSMFPQDIKWYTFTATYNGPPVRTTGFLFMANFVDAYGNYYGADFIKVDYVRFSPN